MKVEVWADIVCPWCGLGLHRLDAALRAFEHRDEVEVVHRSFQLDPTMPEGVVEPVVEMLVSRKGMSEADVRASTARIEAMAAEEGLEPYIVGENRTGSTGLAHELLAYATEEGRHAEAWAALLEAHFGEARSIFTRDALLELAGEIGLDADGAREALTSRRFRDQVAAEGALAQQLGAGGVPFFVIDGRYGVAGAQPAELLLSGLRQAWDESHPAAA